MRIASIAAFFWICHDLAEAGKLRRTDKHGTRVAVFVQAANPSLWSDMQSCIENVAVAHSGPLDVFVSAVGSEARKSFQSSLEKSERMSGAKVQVDEVKNIGADIGQFLQQLQKIPNASTTSYDLILKIHTKSNAKLRHWSLDSLCGSQAAVKKVLSRFAADKSLAMAGGKYMVLHWPNFDLHWTSAGAWHPTEMRAMEKAWPMLSKRAMPPVQKYIIVANSFYWVRGDQLLEGDLPKAIPALLASMPYGYKTGSAAQTSHALERLIPTMIQSKGLKVEEI